MNLFLFQLTYITVFNMYSFKAYKLLVDLLTVHGIDIPISPDRSTLHRWRVADAVPNDQFRLVYYYTRCAVHDHGLHIDLLDMLDSCGFTTEGLC